MRDLTRTRPPAARHEDPARLEVHIDHLVLDGVEAVDASALEAAIRLELERRLAEGGSAGIPQAPRRYAGAPIEVPPGAPADVVGARIAEVVHEAVALHIAPEGEGRP